MLWLIFSIALWGFVHSWVASHGFKEFLRRAFGDGFMKLYRLLYNIFAVVTIAPVLYLMAVLPDKNLYQVPSPWSYIMLAGQGISALLLLIAVLQTDVFSFAGLRHPLYTFSLLILWLSPTVSVNSCANSGKHMPVIKL